MKHLVLILSFFLTINLQAQSGGGSISNNFSLGPIIGYTTNSVRVDNAEWGSGFRVGLTSTYSVSEHSGIGVDLIYSGQGYGENTKLNYLKVPLMFKYFFGALGESFRPKFGVGLTPGFLMSAKFGDVDVKENFKSFEIGVGAGLGFNYKLADRTWLNVDYLLDYGLTDLSKTGEGKNVGHSLSLGVAFGF